MVKSKINDMVSLSAERLVTLCQAAGQPSRPKAQPRQLFVRCDVLLIKHAINTALDMIRFIGQ
jgi:hypothetical protein